MTNGGNIMGATEKAKDIRTELKKRYGWTGKQVSVKSDHYSLGSSINVRIKDPAVWIKQVEDIAESKEEVRRDEWTGEILGGGNLYVNVNYEHAALKVRAARYLADVQEVAGQLEAGTSSLLRIPGTPYLLGRNQNGQLTLWSDHHIGQHYNAESVAEHIAILLEGGT